MTGASISGGIVSKVRAHVTGPRDVTLGLRMLAWAVCLRSLKYLVPLPTLVRIMRRPAGARTRRAEREQQIVVLARWASRAIAWSAGGNCLERGLVTYRYLCSAGAEPLLVVGVGRGADEAVQGHAWVVVDGQAVDDTPEFLNRFERIATFGPDGMRLSAI